MVNALYHYLDNYDASDEDDNLRYVHNQDTFDPFETDPYVDDPYGEEDDEEYGSYDDDDDDDEDDHDHGDEDEEQQKPTETSSVESRCFRSSPSLYFDAFNEGGLATPEAFERLLKDLTIPHLQGLLRQWSLPRTGKKAALVERLMSHLRPLFSGHDRSLFNQLVDQLNDQYALLRRGRMPFSHLPDPQDTIRLLEASRKLDFEYSLPFPWILEEKVSLPMVSAFVERSSRNMLRVEFMTPDISGARYLLVAIKLYRDALTHEFLPYGQSTRESSPADKRPASPPYRHAYIQSFRCSFNGSFYSPHYDSSIPSKVHEITRLLRRGLCSMDLRSFGSYNGRDYYFQIVRARRDPAQWLCLFQTFAVKSASQVFAQLARDFGDGGDRYGISTASITVSLCCPLSLLRLRTPLRSNKCKHPQCFDFASWSQSVSMTGPASAYNPGVAFRCPICDVQCLPDGMYVDGLAQEMLQRITDESIDEVCIDIESRTWRPVSSREEHLSRSSTSCPGGEEDVAAGPILKRKRTVEKSPGGALPIVIDLTETPDDVYFGCTDEVPIKPDPGLLRPDPPIEIPSDGLDGETGPVLDEPDVVASVAIPLLRLVVPMSSPSDHYHRPSRGTSISDAIVID